MRLHAIIQILTASYRFFDLWCFIACKGSLYVWNSCTEDKPSSSPTTSIRTFVVETIYLVTQCSRVVCPFAAGLWLKLLISTVPHPRACRWFDYMLIVAWHPRDVHPGVYHALEKVKYRLGRQQVERMHRIHLHRSCNRRLVQRHGRYLTDWRKNSQLLQPHTCA